MFIWTRTGMSSPQKCTGTRRDSVTSTFSVPVPATQAHLALARPAISVDGRRSSVDRRGISVDGLRKSVDGRAVPVDGRATSVDGRATSVPAHVAKARELRD